MYAVCVVVALLGLVATHGTKYAAQVLAVLDGTRRPAIRRHAPATGRASTACIGITGG